MSDSLRPRGLQHTRSLCPSLFPGVRSNSCPSRQWCYLTTSSSAAPFSFCLQSLPASGPFPMSQPFASYNNLFSKKEKQCVLKIGNVYMLGKKTDSVEGFTMRCLLLTHVSGSQAFISEVSPCQKLPGYHWVAICSSRRFSRPRDESSLFCVSCIGRWILYHWAIMEAHAWHSQAFINVNLLPQPHIFLF